MTEPEKKHEPNPLPPDLEDEARPTLVREFWLFLAENKKWWLIPLIVIFLALGLLILLGGSPLAPFLYPFL